MAFLVTRPSHRPVDLRVLHGALSRLEPGAGKLARRVLRGGVRRKARPLPDYAPSLRSPWRAAVVFPVSHGSIADTPFLRHLREHRYLAVYVIHDYDFVFSWVESMKPTGSSSALMIRRKLPNTVQVLTRNVVERSHNQRTPDQTEV